MFHYNLLTGVRGPLTCSFLGVQHLQFTLAFALYLPLNHPQYRQTDTHALFKCMASFCVDTNFIDFISLEQSASSVLNAVLLLFLLSSLCQRISRQTLSLWLNVWRSDVVEHLCLGLNLCSNSDVDVWTSTLQRKAVKIKHLKKCSSTRTTFKMQNNSKLDMHFMYL